MCMVDEGTSEPNRQRVEIERTYLLDRLPELPSNVLAMRIRQGYMPAEHATGAAKAGEMNDASGAPADAMLEGRIRRTVMPDGSITCKQTIKRGMGLVREETEWSITEQTFDELWPMTRDRRLSKTRYQVHDDGRVWEIDDFDNIDLVIAEIELTDPDAVVTVPDWLAPHIVRDVTDDPAYRNYELAKDLALKQFDHTV